MLHPSIRVRTGTALSLAAFSMSIPTAGFGDAPVDRPQMPVAATDAWPSLAARPLAGPMPDGTTLASVNRRPVGDGGIGLTAAPAMSALSDDSTAPDDTPQAGPKSAEPPIEPPADATESLRDAIVAALKGNPDIQISLAQQDDAYYGVAEARAAWLPHLDATVGYGRE